METKSNYKRRTREEISAWLQQARERKEAFQKKANEILAKEEQLRKKAAESHYYDIALQ